MNRVVRFAISVTTCIFLLVASVAYSNSKNDQKIDPHQKLLELGIDGSPANIRATLANTGQSAEARYWSAVAIGMSKSNDAMVRLAAVLNDENSDVRSGAVVGLGELGDPAAISQLSKILNSDSSEGVRQLSLSALGKIDDQNALEPVRQAVQDTSQPHSIRVSSLKMIAVREPGLDTDNLMRVLVADQNSEIRARAALALSSNNTSEALSYLVVASQTPEVPINVWSDVLDRLQELSGQSFSDASIINRVADPSVRTEANKKIQDWWIRTTN